MPSFSQTPLLITPERFVNSCSQVEIYELWMILHRPDIRRQISYILDAEETKTTEAVNELEYE